MRWKIHKVPDITSMPTGRPLSAARTDYFRVHNFCVNREDRAVHAVSGSAKPFRQQLGVETPCHDDHPLQHLRQM
jgi:hypothetical protein